MNKRYNSIIHGYTKSAPKRVKAKQAKQLARQTSLPLGGKIRPRLRNAQEQRSDPVGVLINPAAPGFFNFVNNLDGGNPIAALPGSERRSSASDRRGRGDHRRNPARSSRHLLRRRGAVLRGSLSARREDSRHRAGWKSPRRCDDQRHPFALRPVHRGREGVRAKDETA